MTITSNNELTPRKPLRLWPAVVIAIVQLLVMFGAPVVAPDAGSPSACLGASSARWRSLVWWLFFSRAPWFERVGAIVLMIVAVLATRAVAHESMAGAGQGMLIYILPTPYLALALVAWAVATRHLQDGFGARRWWRPSCSRARRLRSSERLVSSGAGSEFHWRWTPTPEERLLAQAGDEPKPLPPPTAPAASPADACGDSPSDNTGGRQRQRRRPAAAPAAPAAAEDRSCRSGRERDDTRPSGRAFAGPGATASFAACGSRPTGRSRRRSRSGAGRSDRAGHPSRCTAISSTRRSSVVTTRSSPVTE